MWRVTRPTRTVQETFRTCVRAVRNPGLRTRFERIESSIIQASADYDLAAKNAALHTFVAQNPVGAVTQAELSHLYSRRMAKKDRTARPIYDELLQAPAHGR